MVTLSPPEDVEGDPLEVVEWKELLVSQGDVNVAEMEEGDVCAMQDRSSRGDADAWSDSSRRIYVVRWDEVRVALYTTEGVLIDEPDNLGSEPGHTCSLSHMHTHKHASLWCVTEA